MNYNFTPQDILAYVYGELHADLAVQLEILVSEDEILSKEIKTLRDAKALLESQSVAYNPSQNVVDRILQYAAKKEENKFGVGLYQ